jgi:transposase InsO family protein
MSICDLCARAAVAIESKKERISELSRGRIRGAYDGQPIHHRTVPAVDGRSRRRLLDEPVRQRLGQRAMESFFSSLKTERTARRMYRTRDDAKADVFDYIERFYNPKRRYSTIRIFERQAALA